MNDTFALGVTRVVELLFATLFFIALLDAACALFDLPSIGERVDTWSHANQWYAGALILLMAVFLAHFLLNPLPCGGVPGSSASTVAGTAPAAPAPTGPPCVLPTPTPTVSPP